MDTATTSTHSHRPRNNLIQFEDPVRRGNQHTINLLKPLQPVLDCLLPACAVAQQRAQWWDYATLQGRARFMFWVRSIRGRGYNKASSRRSFISTLRMWKRFCTSLGVSFEVTSASAAGFINWWRRTPTRQSTKPYDTMQGYLKHLSQLQFMQRAVQLDASSLKAAQPSSLFDEHDVQDVLQDLKQAQELMQLRWVC